MIGQRILAATLKRFLGLRPATQVLTLTPPPATQMISDVANYAKERGRITAQRNLARCGVGCIAVEFGRGGSGDGAIGDASPLLGGKGGRGNISKEGRARGRKGDRAVTLSLGRLH